jgi:hypothetical protein
VDHAKIEAIEKLPYPRDIRSFLGHVGFYRIFIKDLSKTSKPLTNILQKDVPFYFSDDCIESFNVTTQDFINFWGKFFAFVLLEMIEISQGFKTFESI